MTFDDFNFLLDQNELITHDFLNNELNISKDNIFSFFYYLEDKKLTIYKNDHFSIIEEMIKAAKTFNKQTTPENSPKKG